MKCLNAGDAEFSPQLYFITAKFTLASVWGITREYVAHLRCIRITSGRILDLLTPGPSIKLTNQDVS